MRALRAGLRVRQRSLLLAVAVTVLLWPVGSFTVQPGLDPSWGAALHLAMRDGLVWGRDVVFTYGPLGFVVDAHPFVTSTWLIAVAAHLVATFLLSYALVALLRRVLPWWGAGLVAFAVMLVLTQVLVVDQPFLNTLVTLVVVLWAGDRIARRADVSSVPVIGVAAVGTAIQLLVKVDSGLAVALALGYTFVVLGFAHGGWRRAARSITAYAGATVLGVIVGWMLLGQPLGALPDWLRTSVWLTSGYSAAMGWESGEQWQYFVAALLVLVVALLVVRGTFPSVRTQWAALGFVALVTVVAAKQGFVRHDVVHVGQFFAVLMVLPVAFVSCWRRRDVLILVAVGSVLLLNTAATPLGHLLDPTTRVEALADTARLTASGRARDDWAAEQRASLRRQEALPASFVARTRGHTTAILPWEQLVAWAWPELRWRPLPVFQAYAAFTRELDDDNASFLGSARRPEYVVRQLGRTIDGRLDRFESPAAQVALVCGYTTVAQRHDWQLLRATEDRCGRPEVVRTVTARLGETVAVPEATPGTVVVARFDGLGDSTTDRLRSLVLRAPETWFRADDGPQRRFVTGTQGSWHLLAGPQCAMTDLGGSGTDSYRTLSLHEGARRDSYRVSFVRIPYRCDAVTR